MERDKDIITWCQVDDCYGIRSSNFYKLKVLQRRFNCSIPFSVIVSTLMRPGSQGEMRQRTEEKQGSEEQEVVCLYPV